MQIRQGQHHLSTQLKALGLLRDRRLAQVECHAVRFEAQIPPVFARRVAEQAVEIRWAELQQQRQVLVEGEPQGKRLEEDLEKPPKELRIA